MIVMIYTPPVTDHLRSVLDKPESWGPSLIGSMKTFLADPVIKSCFVGNVSANPTAVDYLTEQGREFDHQLAIDYHDILKAELGRLSELERLWGRNFSIPNGGQLHGRAYFVGIKEDCTLVVVGEQFTRTVRELHKNLFHGDSLRAGEISPFLVGRFTHACKSDLMRILEMV